MANEMPRSDTLTGLSRKVVEYSEAFTALVAITNDRPLTDADWEPIEALVDVDAYERMGVFMSPHARVIGWAEYRGFVTQYASGGGTAWEGTLRHITEEPGRVILEMEERNIRAGGVHRSNTVTIYEFTDAGLLRHLDVYVMPLG